MLKTLSWRMVARGCAIGILVGLLIVAFELDFPGKICEYNQATKHEDCTTYSLFPFLLIQVFNILNYYGVAITALATVAIGIFTLTLKLSTDRLWKAARDQIAAAENAAKIQSADMNASVAIAKEAADAAKDSADVARKSLVIVQRAFVFIDSFQGDVLIDQLIVAPKWRNSGATPTRYMTNWISWKTFGSEPPDDFTFPDLGEDGNPVDEKDKALIHLFLGPNATTFGQTLIIPKAVLDELRAKNARAFVWGWTKYQDVFDADHVTKFCNEIKILTSWQQGEKLASAISFPIYRRHNCTDEECERQGNK